jgi:hypothetical protein
MTTKDVNVSPDSVSTKKKKNSSFFSVSCGASVLMFLYIGMGGLNFYRLMYPLAFLDVKGTSKLVGPLWEEAAKMRMKVYLSTQKKFQLDFFESEFASASAAAGEDDEEEEKPSSKNNFDSILLWEEDMNEASMSKSFLLTTVDCAAAADAGIAPTCPSAEEDPSFAGAIKWLDHAEHAALGEGGILAELSASAGEGIESTSVLLTLYTMLSDGLGHTLRTIGITSSSPRDDEKAKAPKKRDRGIIKVSADSPLWSTLQSNSTLHVHVVVVRDGSKHTKLESARTEIQQALKSRSILLGHVDLVKYDLPHHISRPKRILYHDISYLLQRYVLRTLDESTPPPWDMQYFKPEEFSAFQESLEMKRLKVGFPYWKPEVAVKYVNDEVWYPIDVVHLSGFESVRLDRKSKRHPTGYAQLPALHVDEIGLTSEKYIPINETLTTLPLRISFDRNDMEQTQARTTATAGGMSPARWRLLSTLSSSLESQKELGFEESDIDDVRRLIADTNVTLLAITMLASALHMLFEFLTFKNEVSFWRNNKDLTGLSVRSLFIDMIGQAIILLFLIEKDSSLLMSIPAAIGVAIAAWKCQRGAGFRFVRLSKSEQKQKGPWWNALPRLFGYELRATRLQVTESEGKEKGTAATPKKDLAALTIEMDRLCNADAWHVAPSYGDCLHALLSCERGAFRLVQLAYYKRLFCCIRAWLRPHVSSAVSELQAQVSVSFALACFGIQVHQHVHRRSLCVYHSHANDGQDKLLPG